MKCEIELMMFLQEIMVGRLVLDLPKEDLKKVNKMLVRNMERKKNAEVQEETDVRYDLR